MPADPDDEFDDDPREADDEGDGGASNLSPEQIAEARKKVEDEIAELMGGTAPGSHLMHNPIFPAEPELTPAADAGADFNFQLTRLMNTRLDTVAAMQGSMA